MITDKSRVGIPPALLHWLHDQSARWRADGLITDATRDGILAGYEAEAPQHYGMQTLVVLGVLICAVGVLLLIGYNWARLGPSVKVTMLMGAVAAAFGGSAMRYRAGRHTSGEALAFAGTLMFGNAIWLIAQVLHIQGHFPDAFLWAAAGALASAWLLRSAWNGIAAAVLLIGWGIAEGVVSPGNNYLFVPIWMLVVVVAHKLGSRPMLGVAAIALVTWVAVLDQGRTPGPIWAASILLTGCAAYAHRSWEGDGGRFRIPWRIVGLATLLVCFVPLMIVEAQRSMLRGDERPPLAVLVVAGIMALGALSGILRARTAPDWVVIGLAAAASAWSVAVVAGAGSPISGAVIFSVGCLSLSVALIKTALDTGRLGQLAAGVLFAVAFLLVRWLSLLENMLWSGGLLLVAGGGLLVLAKLWRARDREPAAGGVS